MYATTGLTATKMNHCLSSNGSNQWQCVKLFIDYLYLLSQAYQSASTDARGAHQTGVITKARATEGGLGERE
jgi:hypothetical protein